MQAYPKMLYKDGAAYDERGRGILGRIVANGLEEQEARDEGFVEAAEGAVAGEDDPEGGMAEDVAQEAPAEPEVEPEPEMDPIPEAVIEEPAEPEADQGDEMKAPHPDEEPSADPYPNLSPAQEAALDRDGDGKPGGRKAKK